MVLKSCQAKMTATFCQCRVIFLPTPSHAGHMAFPGSWCLHKKIELLQPVVFSQPSDEHLHLVLLWPLSCTMPYWKYIFYVALLAGALPLPRDVALQAFNDCICFCFFLLSFSSKLSTLGKLNILILSHVKSIFIIICLLNLLKGCVLNTAFQ